MIYTPPAGRRDVAPGRCSPACCKTPLGHAHPTPAGCNCHAKPAPSAPPDYTVEMNADYDRDELPWVTCYLGHALRAFATKGEADTDLARVKKNR